MQRNIKNSFLVPFFYGFIIAFVNNIIPILFTYASKSPGIITDWMRFTKDSSILIAVANFLSHFLPMFFCVSYVFLCKKEKFKIHFINYPIAFSLFGISGWVIGFFEQIILLFLAKNKGFDINIFSFANISALNSIFAGIITFTLSYFILESIHRQIVLPRTFPEGRICKIEGVRKASIKFLFKIVYVSVVVLPILFIFSLYLLTIKKYSIEIDSFIFIIFGILIFMGILIISFFRIFFFEKPLKKFNERIQKFNEGDSTSKISIITNDFFGELADSFNDMTDSIQEKTEKILSVQESVIQGMAIMVESRDNSTGGHIKRTSDCVKVFVNELKKSEEYKNLPNSFFDNVIKAAPMHDLGKITVDDVVLRKPGKYTDEEYKMMKTHSKEGARIVENVLQNTENLEFKNIAINVAHFHHEKWDGSGYPEKIKGEKIPLEARIMALADVFDALVSKRCYKEEFSFDVAFKIIEDSLGTHFDPTLGKIFLQCKEQLQDLYIWNVSN